MALDLEKIKFNDKIDVLQLIDKARKLFKIHQLSTDWKIVEKVEADQLIGFNSKKSCAVVTRRGVTVEPFEHPETNEYGFIASTRAKIGILVPKSITVGETTP